MPTKISKIHRLILSCLAPSLLFANIAQADAPTKPGSLVQDDIARELGWVHDPANHCGGYYLEQPFTYPLSIDQDADKKNAVEVTSNQGLLSQKTTSTLEGEVTVTRQGQQITAHKAYLYRDPETGKLSSIDMLGDVHLREPNTLVIGKEGQYNFETKAKSLFNILYRTSLSSPSGPQFVGAKKVSQQERQQTRKVTTLTAWGSAHEFSQDQPRLYNMYQTTYSTCPPLATAWHIKASHIVLNKNTGRGTATHARLYIGQVPVFYSPYLNFSIDRQRKSGFLAPTPGTSSRWGPYILAPYYWNMAPNYDMTLTPGYLSERGLQLNDTFRYLSTTSTGKITASVLPGDREFQSYQHSTKNNTAYSQSPNPVTQSEFNRLMSDNDTRKAFVYRDQTHFNDNWSSHVDFNYVGDDYYLEDFGGNLNEVMQNQLIQEAGVDFKSPHWHFSTLVQGYQTLNPINQSLTLTQYRRLPQLMLNGDYPDEPFGLDYFVESQATHFEIHNTPGINTVQPIGDRAHVQPGISLPLYGTDAFINPRIQFALTDYSLQQTQGAGIPHHEERALPIFDIASGVNFARDTHFFGTTYTQTLEPQVYYEYIPYHQQSNIPLFDTTLNTLAYDQLFNYNRFSSIDRIGDANQVSVGIASRFIDTQSGYQKIRLAAGEIFYLADRRVTLCNSNTGPFGCSDYPENPANHYSLSPLSGELDYNVNPYWRFTAIPIWDPVTKQLANALVNFNYALDSKRVINFGYNYVRNGDVLSGGTSVNPKNNLKSTDISMGWPIIGDIGMVARYSQDWNLNRLQNLVYGLQYDTCCWAVRAVGARNFAGINPNDNNRYLYDTQFYIQFDLKGLTNIQTGDPTNLLSNITGYDPQFGQAV